MLNHLASGLAIENVSQNQINSFIKQYDIPMSFVAASVLGQDFSDALRIVEFSSKIQNSKTFSTMRNIVNAFFENGGKVEDIVKGKEIYDYINGCKVLDINGKRLTLQQKFMLLDVDREPLKADNAFLKLKIKVIDFVSDGGNLDDLKKEHPLYSDIHNAKIKDENGKNLTFEKLLDLMGFERKPKYSQNVKSTLIFEVEEFLKNGGNFHIKRKSLPFYERLRTYKRSLEVVDGRIRTNQEVMRELGFNQYSDLYFRLMRVEEMQNYRDKNGFVDTYKKTDFKGFVNEASQLLSLPIPVFVGLLCNENLESCFVDAEYFGYVKKEILDYVKIAGTLENVMAKNNNLYNKIRNINRYLCDFSGEKFSNKDVLEFLELGDIKNNFSSSVTIDENYDFSDIMRSIYENSAGQNGKILKTDIPQSVYRKVIFKSIKFGITTKALFKLYGMDYVDGRNVDRLKRVSVNKYPYIDEMRTRRDELMSQSNISLKNGNSKEEVFEELVSVCQKTYKEFKKDIFNFDENLTTDSDKISENKTKEVSA